MENFHDERHEQPGIPVVQDRDPFRILLLDHLHHALISQVERRDGCGVLVRFEDFVSNGHGFGDHVCLDGEKVKDWFLPQWPTKWRREVPR